MLKIIDKLGKLIGILKDEDTEPKMLKEVIEKIKEETKEEELKDE